MLHAEDIRLEFIKHGQRVGSTTELNHITWIADRNWLLRQPNEPYQSNELRWFLSESRNVKDLGHIAGFIPKIWKEIAEVDGQINSNYGWCVYSEENFSQFKEALNHLKQDENTRRAIMVYTRPSIHKDAIANRNQEDKDYKDLKSDMICTIMNHFFIRNNTLDMKVIMRSMDAVFGYNADQIWFEWVFNDMYRHLKKTYPDLKLGNIIIHADSLHVYDMHKSLIEPQDSHEQELWDYNIYLQGLSKDTDISESVKQYNLNDVKMSVEMFEKFHEANSVVNPPQNISEGTPGTEIDPNVATMKPVWDGKEFYTPNGYRVYSQETFEESLKMYTKPLEDVREKSLEEELHEKHLKERHSKTKKFLDTVVKPVDNSDALAPAKEKISPHYKPKYMEHWDFAITYNFDHLMGSITKYAFRFNKKGQRTKDLMKIKEYAEKLADAVIGGYHLNHISNSYVIDITEELGGNSEEYDVAFAAMLFNNELVASEGYTPDNQLEVVINALKQFESVVDNALSR